MAGVSEHLLYFFGRNLHDSFHLVQPQAGVRGLDDSGHRAERHSISRLNFKEAAGAEKLQPQFTTGPDVIRRAANDLDSPQIDPIFLGVFCRMFSINQEDLAGRITEPETAGRVTKTGAWPIFECASNGWDTARPVRQVPGSIVEPEGSGIIELDPESVAVGAWHQIPHPARLRILGQQEVSEGRVTLAPDPGARSPPDISIGVAKNAGDDRASCFGSHAFAPDLQQGFVIDGSNPEVSLSSCQQRQTVIALRQCNRDNLIVAEADESIRTTNPDIPLMIFEDLVGISSGKALLWAE